MTKWTRVNDEIYSATSSIVSINAFDMATLKDQVVNCPNRRIRICAHQSSNDNLHEMLIVIAKGSYIRPHKHINKGESFHIIEGMLDVVIFDNDGNIIEKIEMGEHASGKHFFYRLSDSHFHTLILRTDLVVFHETTNGPFKKDDTIYAPWSPENDEIEAKNTFMSELERKIQSN